MSVLHLLKNLEIALGADKEPPKEFRIFAFGEIESEKGTFKFDREAGEAMVARFKRRGVDAYGDYEHASLSDPPPAEGAPSPMWYQLELRDDGLWATNVRWTPRASEYLKNGEYRYYSPAFLADVKTKRINTFFNVALTNDPATHDISALVAASARARDRRATKLSAAMSFDQIRAALQEALRRMLAADGLYGWVCDVYDDTFVYCVGDDLFQAPYLVEGSDAVIGEPTEVQRTYTPIVDDDDAQEKTQMKTLLKMLGVAETASETEAVVALTAMKKTSEDAEAELIKLTGAKNRSEAFGIIAAGMQARDQVEKLSTKVKELEGAAVGAEVEKLVGEGVRDGKITPATKDFWLEQGKKDVVALKTFLEKAPKVVNTTEDAKKPAGQETVMVALSEDEKQIAKRLGVSEKDYLDTKKRHLERAQTGV